MALYKKNRCNSLFIYTNSGTLDEIIYNKFSYLKLHNTVIYESFSTILGDIVTINEADVYFTIPSYILDMDDETLDLWLKLQ